MGERLARLHRHVAGPHQAPLGVGTDLAGAVQQVTHARTMHIRGQSRGEFVRVRDVLSPRQDGTPNLRYCRIDHLVWGCEGGYGFISINSPSRPRPPCTVVRVGKGSRT